MRTQPSLRDLFGSTGRFPALKRRAIFARPPGYSYPPLRGYSYSLFLIPRDPQNVGGVLTHNSQVSVRPGFFQLCGVALSK